MENKSYPILFRPTLVLLCGLSYGLRSLPRSGKRVLAALLGLFFFHVLRFRRTLVLENLTRAFRGERTLGEIKRLAQQNYEHYALTLFEIIESLTWSKEDYVQRIQIEGWEHIEPLLKEGKGGFFLSCHLGNWEFSFCGPCAKGLPADIVVKKARSEMGEALLQWFRTKSGARILWESGTARDIYRSVNQGRFVVFVLDQFMGPPIGLPVTFFGELAGTAVALALMTEKRDIPVFTAYGYRDQAGINHTVIGPPIQYGALSDDKDTRLFQKTQCYNNELESMIRQHPEQWLWLHRRWKPYRGEPRWSLKKTLAACAFLLLLVSPGCSSGGSTPTGIALPPDPSVAVPHFKQDTENSGDEGDEEDVAAPSPTPTPVPIPKRQYPHVTHRRRKLHAKHGTSHPSPASLPAPNSPTTTPSPTPSLVDVVPSDKIPFEVGEQLIMDLRWTALPAGRVVMEVRRGPTFDGRETYHLWGNALSSKIVDTIYHVDNTIESFVDQQALIPYKFLLHMVESKQLKETRVLFDHTQGKAYYWAKRISQRWGNMEVNRTDPLVPEARDMFSALYYARALHYELNKPQRFAIYENGTNWQVDLTPVANELVTSRVGAFQCWKIKVDVSLNNVLKPTGDMYMWLSDDSKKYLVKFQAKVKIGSLYGDLTSIREH